ncbi:MAG: TonB-dependent receptor [Bacteroidales bacterium]|nr:TonB-dependent receptor [Bacteroidales bacterium]
MKNIIISIILILFSVFVFSQKKTDANINGHVLNKVTGEHIPFYNVFIKGTTIGTTTDATGHYYMKNLPEGNFTIVASCVGYKPVEKQVSLISGKTIEVNFDVEEDAVQLESIVVSANRNEVSRKESPTIVNVITPRLFENTNSVCLAQGLNFQPGLRVETNCQNCGFQQVRINGLDGPYSQILIDSRPIFSALAGVYGIEQIPTNMIERVEVVRGGGSALFGSSAIAGVINIITKEPTSNSIVIANTTNLIGGKKTDINTSFNASVVADNNKSGIMVFGSSRQRSPFDYDGDGFTEIGKIDVKNIGFRGFYRMSNYSKLTLEYHNLGEFRRGGNKLGLAPHETDITEQTEHNINSGGLKYDIFSKNNKHRLNVYSSAQNIDRDSYYGAQKDLNAYGKTTDITFVAGTQYSYSIDTLLFMPAVLTMGAEYSLNEMDDKQIGYNRIISQKVNTKSAFVQNEWKNKKLSILLGSRFDKHNLIKNPILSPRLNLRYSPNEHINLRASYSSGFRAPQAFDEDLHITAVGGEVALIQLDPDLNTEKSQSYSASIDLYKNFGKVKTNLLIEGFYTNLDNVFVLEKIGTDSVGNIILERTNGSGAVVRGINLEGKIVPNKKMQFQFGMTLQKSEYKEIQLWSDNVNLVPHKKMFRSPDQYAYITANYQVFKPMTISLSGTYTGSMLVQHFAGYVEEDTEKRTPDFYDVNLKLSYDFKLNNSAKLQLNGGIQNIFNSYQNDFDKGEYRDSGYIYGPAYPRTFFLGIKAMI